MIVGLSRTNMKCLLIVFGAVAVCAASPDCGGGNKTHNFYYGIRAPMDRVLYIDHLIYKSKWMQITSDDVTYPQNGGTPAGTIDYIEVLDQRSDGTGGCVYLSSGGVGHQFVTFHLKSQRNHGMDFVLKIYGR